MKRIKTHIPGFDELIENGLPQGSTILVSGIAGTGKTILSLEYLYNGATRDNHRCLYFTFEEKKKALIEQAGQFGWDLEKLEKNQKLKIISMGTENIDMDYVEQILEIIKTFKPQRTVIDSINTLAYLATCDELAPCEHNIKKFIYYFLAKFKQIEDLTSIFISQKDNKTSNTIAEYICDGIINIDYESMGGDFSRTMTIRKMRRTKNNEDLHPLEISKEGIRVHNI